MTMKNLIFSITFVFTMTFCCFSTVAAQPASPQAGEDKVYLRSEVDTQAVVLRKPRAQTDGRCGRGSSGTIIIQLILRKSGVAEIANVAQSSPCAYFNESAGQAARAVEFTPAVKDGQAVSMRVTVQYNFRTY
jgi:TonB family protein